MTNKNKLLSILSNAKKEHCMVDDAQRLEYWH